MLRFGLYVFCDHSSSNKNVDIKCNAHGAFLE